MDKAGKPIFIASENIKKGEWVNIEITLSGNGIVRCRHIQRASDRAIKAAWIFSKTLTQIKKAERRATRKQQRRHGK
jgi:hypothetical protein